MSGSTPSNSQAVDFEKQQAAEADAKEAARQQRLQQGQTLIDQIFSGTPVMKKTSSPFDWSSLTDASKAPAGYTASYARGMPGGGGRSGMPSGAQSSDVAAGGGGSSSQYASHGVTGNTPTYGATTTNAGYGGNAATPGGWNLTDASGNVYGEGDPLDITTETDTGQRTGGFDDAFYNSYRQKVLDYYNPDEERQYSEAKRDLTYNLARAGTLQSSTAGDKQGELAYNDALQKANIVANANTQTGNLKNQIQANKESLINQLYATEDPTLTANLAQSSAAASRLQDPNLTPAAALFTPALTAVGAVGNYATSPYSPYGTGNTGSTSPAVRPASETSGRLSGGGGYR